MLEAFRRIMVIAPHSDDETYGCGGLLHRFTSQGAEAHVVLMTVGDVHHVHLRRTVTAAERITEFNAACDVLGVRGSSVMFPGYDTRLDDVGIGKMVWRLDEEIRRFHPTAFLFPTESHHQDHVATHKAARSAIRLSPVTRGISFIGMYEYPMSNLSDQHTKVFVNVTDSIDKKMEALACHKSQVQDSDDHPLSPDNVRLFAKFRGSMSGMKYAECLYPVRVSI